MALPEGNVWEPSHRNASPRCTYYGEARLVTEPVGLVSELIEGIGETVLQPGWRFDRLYTVNGNDLMLIFCHPEQTATYVREQQRPPYDQLVRPEAMFRLPEEQERGIQWQLRQQPFDAIVAKANLAASTFVMARFNDIFLTDNHPRHPHEGTDLTHSGIGGTHIQTGVGILDLHFSTIDELLAERDREQGRLEAAKAAKLAEVAEGFDQHLARNLRHKADLAGRKVDNPVPLFG